MLGLWFNKRLFVDLSSAGENLLWGKGGRGQYNEGDEDASLRWAGVRPGGALHSAPRLASVGAIGHISFNDKRLVDFLRTAPMTVGRFNRSL